MWAADALFSAVAELLVCDYFNFNIT